MRRVGGAVLILVGLLSASAAEAASVTLRKKGTSELNASTVISALPGAIVELEVVLDTAGLSFQGYAYDIHFTPAAVSSIDLTQQSLPPLVANLFGAATINDETDRIDNINQGTLGTGLTPGIYTIDEVSFVVDSIPPGGISIAALLGPGDTFGLGGVSVTPTFFGATVVPEPAPGWLLAVGLAALSASRRTALANASHVSARRP